MKLPVWPQFFVFSNLSCAEVYVIAWRAVAQQHAGYDLGDMCAQPVGTGL